MPERRRDLLHDLDPRLFERLAARDPCDAEPDLPLVLLPVRLETRYVEQGRQLKVRIYPDEVHLDRLDGGLSDGEREAGIAYWTKIWAEGSQADDAAWQELVHATRPERAAYVAHALTPRNLADRPDDPGAAEPRPDFPDTGPPRVDGAVARALPDRFVALAIQGSAATAAAGKPVPSELTVGLPRAGGEEGLGRSGGLVVGPGMEWMVDYDQAERVGMAVTLTLGRANAPVDRLLVFGLRSSLDPDASAAELAGLLTSHRFTRGLAFVPQGSPTNNTETDRTDWQRRPPPSPVPTRVPSAALPADANAARAASALGVDPQVLASLEHAPDRERGKARAANTALWAPSWGTFLERLIAVTPSGASLDDGRRRRLRDLFQDHVRGRGPIPALRVGDQPYGVLPVASVDRRWRPDEADPLERSLAPLLGRIRQIWRSSLANVPHLADGPLDEELLEILGSAPLMQGLRVRSVASTTSCSTAPFIAGIQEENTILQEQLDTILWEMLGFESGSGLLGVLGSTTKPLGLPLVHGHDPAFIQALLDDKPRTVESVLQALLELAEDKERKAIGEGSPDGLVGTLVDRGAERAGELRADLGAVAAEGFAQRSPADLHGLADRVEDLVGPSGPSLLLEHQPVAAVRGSLAEVAMQPQLESEVAATAALHAVGAWLRAGARYGEFRAALAELAATTLEERRLLVAEALDLASHRLDAWITALVSRRLESLRAARPAGALIGAYGWIEDLAPGAITARDGGWIHAPSLNHAATAGILRSGYLTHNPDGAGSGALAIDLSSERVRTGFDLLEGIRQGQPLAALLGYRIERRLHEAELDRFILSLRTLSPLVAGKLTDRGDIVPQPAQEAISANNVVDGVRLLAFDRTLVRTKLADPPANNPYLDPKAWKAPTAAEWGTISGALDEAACANDAVADLLLAEGVHQLAQGNTARAAAALDAAAAGDSPPVEADVARSPQRGVAFTHRLLLLLPDAPAGSGWAGTTPRAAAEPRLEAWAESVLGPAGDTVLYVAGDGAQTGLDQAALSALDVVYASSDPAALERRLRAAIPALAAEPLTDARDPGWALGKRSYADTLELAASLRRLLAGARAALPPDFARSNDEPVRAVSGLAELETRVKDASKALGKAEAALGALLKKTSIPKAKLDSALIALEDFGISAPPVDNNAAQLEVARAAHAEFVRRETAVAKILADATTFSAETGLAAGKAIFGDAFWMLPMVEPGATPDLFSAALGVLHPGAARIRRFLRDVATVRDGAGRYAETLLFSDALGGKRPLHVAQLAAPGTPGTGRWIALPFDPAKPSPDAPVTSVVVEAPDGVDGKTTVAGLVLDEWAEVAPRRVAVKGADGQERREARALTGVAVNANAPNARPPQAILLAVSPDGARWSSAALADTLEETLELAKLRAVTLERTVWAGRILPALQEQSWSLQGDKTIDIKFLTTFDANAVLRFVKD